MFGIEEPAQPPATGQEQPPQLNAPAPYVVTQMLPATDWLAVFDPEKGKPYTRNLACFGLVQTLVEGGLTQLVRPLVADDDGTIVDVDAFEDFLMLLPPGRDPFTLPISAMAQVDEARKRRDEADEE